MTTHGTPRTDERAAECREIEHDEVADVIDDLLDRLAAAIARAEAAEARVAVVRSVAFSGNASAILYGITGTTPDTYSGISTDDALEAAGDLVSGRTVTEWGVRYPDGSVCSCGHLDGISEDFAHKALTPDPRIFNPGPTPEAIVTRQRTIYDDDVTEWTTTTDREATE